MHLTLTPQAGLPGQPETTLHVQGEILTVDGTAHDLAALADGPAEDRPPLVGPVRRIEGAIHATVIVRLDETAADDQPHSPWIIAAIDGPVTIPAARRVPEPG